MTKKETQEQNPVKPLIPNRKVGIIGYGAYVPRYRLPGTEVARAVDRWHQWFAG